MKTVFCVRRPHVHQLVLNVYPGQGVDLRKGFVEQKHLWFHSKRSGESDPLTHPAGKRRRFLVFGSREADHVDIALHVVVKFFPVPLSECRFDRQVNIFVDTHPRQQRKILKYDHAVETRRIDFPAVEDDRALARLFQSRDDVEQRAFTAARVAHHGDELAFVDVQTHVFENTEASASGFRESFADLLDFQKRHWLLLVAQSLSQGAEAQIQ